MPPPNLNWKFLGRTQFATGSLTGAHAALNALGLKTVYPDGTARTPGTGSAWTWTLRVNAGINEAVTGVPPTNALGWTHIIAGTSAITPLAASLCPPDTLAQNNAVLIGMNRNTTGAYTTWNSATPFTTAGTFTGYWHVTPDFASTNTILVWESQEACIIQYADGIGGMSMAVFGAWIDPLEYVAGTTCETDERLYAMSASGFNAPTPSTWLSTNNLSTGILGNFGAANRNSHTGYVTPGTATVAGNYLFRFGLFSNTTYWPSYQSGSRDGTPVIVPFSFTNTATGAFIGETRDFGVVPDQLSGTALYDQYGLKGWAAGYSPVIAGDCVLLKV
jgi:hypothetical protein